MSAESIGARDFLTYVLFILVSVGATSVALVLSPFTGESAEPGTVPRLFGVVVFFTVFLSLNVIEWYRRQRSAD